MLFGHLEEMSDEVNSTKPFIWSCFKRDAIVVGVAAFQPLLPPPATLFVSMPLAAAELPHVAEVWSGGRMGSNYNALKAQKSSNEE